MLVWLRIRHLNQRVYLLFIYVLNLKTNWPEKMSYVGHCVNIFWTSCIVILWQSHCFEDLSNLMKPVSLCWNARDLKQTIVKRCDCINHYTVWSVNDGAAENQPGTSGAPWDSRLLHHCQCKIKIQFRLHKIFDPIVTQKLMTVIETDNKVLSRETKGTRY